MSKPILKAIDRALAVVPNPLKPGDLLGDYRLLEQLGEGSFGDVWRAENAHHGRVAAVKVFMPERFEPGERRAAAERFTDGVTAMQRLHEDQRVIDLYEGPTTTGGHLWFAMRYYPHKDLQRWIEQHPDTSYETRLQILDDVLAALKAAHALGIVHRDVRPGNILIDDDGGIRAVLADFDIAYFEEFLRKREKTAAFLGWPRYVPADIFGATGEEISIKLRRPGNDLYALSVVALDLLAGRKVSIPESPKPRNLKVLFPSRNATTPYGLPASTRRRLANFFALALSHRTPPFGSVAAFRLAWMSAVTSTRSLGPLLVVPFALLAVTLTTADWAYDRFHDAFVLRMTTTAVAAMLGCGVLVSGAQMFYSIISGAIPPWKQRATSWLSGSPLIFWIAGVLVALASVMGCLKTWPGERAHLARVEAGQSCFATSADGQIVQWFISQNRTLLDVRAAASLRCPESSSPALTGRSWITPIPAVQHAPRPSGKLRATRLSLTDFSARLPNSEAVAFSLIGVRPFTQQGLGSPAWSGGSQTLEVELPVKEAPRLAIVRQAERDLGERLLDEGWVQIDAAKQPPAHYAEVERQAQLAQRGNWKIIAEQERHKGLLAQCPEGCCGGTLCEDKPTCTERWRCSFCRDGDDAVSWRIRLERATLEHPEDWSNVKVCLSVGDRVGLNCVMRSDAGTDLGFFDGIYTRRKVSNAYFVVMGTNRQGQDERIGHKALSLRVTPNNLCSPWGIGDFTIRNGGVRAVVLSMRGPLPR